MSLFPNKVQVIDSINFKVEKNKIEESFLKEKYIQEGFTSKEIAQLSFSSRQTIHRYLKKHNIPQTEVSRRVSGGHVYGYRKYSGKSIEAKKEQDIIGLIKAYRDKGLSYQKIADNLNDQKIETKMKKGVWYSKVIRQVVLRNKFKTLNLNSLID